MSEHNRLDYLVVEECDTQEEYERMAHVISMFENNRLPYESLPLKAKQILEQYQYEERLLWKIDCHNSVMTIMKNIKNFFVNILHKNS